MQVLDDLKNHALTLMKSAGFPIKEEIAIAVGEKPPTRNLKNYWKNISVNF